MPNYANGKIYAIRSNITQETYIGGTTQTLHRRMHQHKLKNNVCSSALIINCGDAFIELLELFPCENKNQLMKREAEIIRSMDCVNRSIPGRSARQYYLDNKQEADLRSRQYYVDHREKAINYQKEYYEANKQIYVAKAKVLVKCDCGSEVRRGGLRVHLKSRKHIGWVWGSGRK